jgi:hypothetical protein
VRSRGAWKHTLHPLLHFAKARGLTASAITQQASENYRLCLRIPVSSCLSSRRLPVVLAHEERERKRQKSKREKVRDRTSLAVLYSWSRYALGRITSATK